MTIETRKLTVGGVRISVVRKPIKNLHLGVYPPGGRVRVAVPLAVSDAAVRVAVIRKLRWIQRQQAAFHGQARESEREMVSGESHYFLGRRYRLEVVYADAPPRVSLRGGRRMELRVRTGADAASRQWVLHRWYRQRLRELVPPLIEKWQLALGVELADWGIKAMKTKWGSCNPRAKRIWLNLELAKKPLSCLEYLVVHELAHLLVRNHDARFIALMNLHLPRWRQHRATLNAAPLSHAEWTY